MTDHRDATERARRLASAAASLVPPEHTLAGYLLRLSRPRFWLYLAGPVVVGVTYGAIGNGGPDALFAPLSLALFAYFLLPANVFLYGVNDAFDADVDEHNPKKDEDGREVRFRQHGVVAMVVTFCGAAGAMFIFLLPSAARQVLALYFFLAIQYSAPPLRFKTTPFLDSVSNGLYALPGVIAFTATAGVAPPPPAVAGAWLWTMGMHTFSAIPDIEPDREAGIRTTATFLGEGRTYAYCALAWLAAAVGFGLVDLRLGALLGLYPVLTVGVAVSDISADRAYWWFPIVNTVVGALLTMGGLWVMLYG
jgi:4-hydroxybenzoate polyprenyltransferase